LQKENSDNLIFALSRQVLREPCYNYRKEHDDEQTKHLEHHKLHHAYVDIFEVPIRHNCLEKVGRQGHGRREPGRLQGNSYENAEPNQIEPHFSHKRHEDGYENKHNGDPFQRPSEDKYEDHNGYDH